MSTFEDHPSVRLARVTAAAAAAEAPHRLSSEELRALVLAAGADDCGFVRIDDPALDGERASVLRCFPRTRTLVALIVRMNREPVRSVNRSVANLEFHRTGDEVDDVARTLVRTLEARGIAALNPAMAFPMELERFPERGWIVAHKVVAQAAGLGKMGIHRSLIHPKFGSFVLLGTVFVDVDVDRPSTALEYNPCVECKLCVAACPVGAIKPDGQFDFGSCYTHNYQQFMGGFVNWIEDIADSRSARDYGEKVSYAETTQRWQSLSYGPNYNAAYCLAVCPAGEEVIGRFATDRKGFTDDVLRPLQQKVEPVYVARNSDAAAHVAKRFPHKRARYVRASGRATTIATFLSGLRLSFNAGQAGDLDAVYHFVFSGSEAAQATVTISGKTLRVTDGLIGKPDLTVRADAATWIRFLNGRTSIVWCLLRRTIRLTGPPRLLAAFGRCFPS